MTNTIEDYWKQYLDILNFKLGKRICKSWFEEFEKRHQWLRNFLGGVSKTIEVESDEMVASISYGSHCEISSKILFAIPKYFAEYNFNTSLFNNKNIRVGDYAGIKVTKHICTWMARNQIDQKISEDVQLLLSKIGLIWNKSESEKNRTKITITTNPLMFVHLGSFGDIDYKSCFRQGSTNESNKYTLGNLPNSYILIFGGDEHDALEKNNGNIYARAWGVATTDYKCFSVNNYYARPGVLEGTVNSSLRKFFEQIFKTSDVAVEDIPTMLIDGVYVNRNYKKRFFKPPNSSVLDTTLYPSKESLSSPPCAICLGSATLNLTVDDIKVCEYCSRTAKRVVCEYSGEKTFNLVSVVNKDGKTINVCKKLISNKVFVECNGKFYHNTLVGYMRSSLVPILKSDAEQIGYAKCSSCNYYCKYHEIDQNCNTCKFCPPLYLSVQ